MADELLDVIDENNQVVGQKTKSEVHVNGDRHRVSAVLLRNTEGKYLIPTASDLKVEAGGLFHSAAGHVPTGETYIQAAKRELWEETGLKADEKDFEYLGSFWVEKDYSTRKEKERFEIFRIEYKENMGEVTLNEEQTNEQWLSEEELKDVYLRTPDKISYPLRLSCEKIFGFKVIEHISLLDIKDKKVLLCVSKGKTKWQLPGGKKENEETDEQALVRECREEIGVEVKPESIKLFEVIEGQAFGKTDGVKVNIKIYTAQFSGEVSSHEEVVEAKYMTFGEVSDTSEMGWEYLKGLKQKGLIV